MVLGLLAISKAGGAYVPLDPDYPKDRLDFILEDASLDVVLTRAGLADALALPAERLVRLDADAATVHESPPTNPSALAVPTNLAYALYTSGSTGRPKGTMISHAGLVNYLSWATEYYRVASGRGPLVHSPLGFDLTVTSLLAPLVVGQSIHLLPDDVTLDDLGASLSAHQDACLLKLTPSHLAVLRHQLSPDDAATQARTLVLGGDQLTGDAIAFWREHAPSTRIVNEYGPTETVVGCCIYEVSAQDAFAGAVPIGRPIANTQLYVMDTNAGVVPDGVSGELHIGGMGVARGYLGRPGLTAEKFVPNPYGREIGERLYRTGDLSRRLADGNLEYQGRVDHQVKIRGYRIELGEIETVLSRHESVGQAAVLVREAESGTRQLAAYVETEGAVSGGDLRDFLITRLPAYMVPSTYVLMDTLPLTENGKIDRRALPATDACRAQPETTYVAPRTPVERRLAALWAEFLDVEQIGIHDNFFELGGDSIQSIQIIARCIQGGLALTSQQLFEHPTIAELVAQLDASDDASDGGAPSIGRVERGRDLPLSFAQERLWFLDQLDPDSGAYNIAAAVRVHGPLVRSALEQTVSDTVRRHEILRTTFSVTPSGPVQAIGEAAPISFSSIDLSATARETHRHLCERLAAEEAQRPFDLENGPLLRGVLIRVAETEHLVLLTMHHVVSDLWSMGILLDELSKTYEAYDHGQPSPLGELPVQYADYASWQRERLGVAVLDRQLSYWKKRLHGAPPSLEIPTDRPRPPVQTFRGARHRFALPDGVTHALKAINLQEETTLFMSLLAAFQILLHRWTGRTDILVGTPIAGREQAEIQDLIGFFVNTLVLRGDVDPSSSYRDLLARTRDAALEAYAHQDLPFERLVDELGLERDLSRTPLFQVMFVFGNAPVRRWDFADVTLEPLDAASPVAKFDLMLDMTEAEDSLIGSFEYNTDLFDVSTIERMAAQFVTLLAGITTEPERQIEGLSLLPEHERRLVLDEWNETQAEDVDDSPVHRLFEAQVERSPDAVALTFDDEQLSYGSLNARANQLAHHLRSVGVGPEVRVAICLHRSVELVVGILAILKSGGTYVALDPDYPADRSAFILADSRASVLVTRTSLVDRLQGQGTTIVDLDRDGDAIGEHETTNPAAPTGPELLSHVIYTSGSTGVPKGVAIEHRSVVTLVRWSREHYDDADLAHVLAATSVCFDLSVWELFVPLSYGGNVVLVENALALGATPHAAQVTLVNTVPSAIAELLRLGKLSPSVRSVNLAGEPLPTRLADEIYRLGTVRQVCDLYGPSEDTTYSTFARRERGERATIGRPVANTRVYLRDRSREPVPVGVPGELHIGGKGLARGYLDRPDLTAERFVPDPYGSGEGKRLYRTGDLVRWMPAGKLEFLGRLDHQVKVRGYRIELGEIETVLGKHENIRDAVVLARRDSPGADRLVAYVTSEGDTPSVSALREHLQERLPAFMVPAAFVVLDALPLTPNGKVDRRALPAPESARPELEEGFVAPRTPNEHALGDIWCQVLGLERVGVHDNFFELGGDSILGIQIVSRANQIGLHLSPQHVFQHQTVADLAGVAGTVSAVDAEQGVVTGDAPLTPIQEWFFAQAFEEPHHFNQAILLEVRRPLDASRLERAVEALREHHDALRLRFERDGDGWRQSGAGPGGAAPLTVVDLAMLSGEEQRHALETEAAKLQAELDLSKGPLFRAALFEMGESHDRLLLVSHHLAVDGLSWRILLEDLAAAYDQAEQETPVRLPPKTTSFARWAEWCRDHASSGGVDGELDYWLAAPRRDAKPLPLDHPNGRNDVESTRTVSVSLDAGETEALLRDVPDVYRTQISDVLLAALLEAVTAWTKQRSLLLDLEGHGREDVAAEIDSSRTVGWFTTMFPVLLESPADGGAALLLKSVKEQLRTIPNRGLGYGMLRFLGPPDVAERLRALPGAELSFNYLGQFDHALPETSGFAWASDPIGPTQSPRAHRSHVIEVSGVVSAGRLKMSFGFSENLHRHETIGRLAEGFVESLRGLIRHCQSPEAGGYTPSDFPLAGLEQASLDAAVGANRAVEDLYPLSPMQQGLLFHTMSDPDSGVYFEQLHCTIRGSLDVERFRRAWQHVVDRHPALRGAVRAQSSGQPLQIVLRDAQLAWDEQDWRGLSRDDQETRLETYLRADRERGFDPAVPPLMRMALLRQADDAYRFVWSHHHLLLDGWSLPIVIKEVLELYETKGRGESMEAAPPRPYRDYIAWLADQDASAGRGAIPAVPSASAASSGRFVRSTVHAIRAIRSRRHLADRRCGRAGERHEHLGDTVQTGLLLQIGQRAFQFKPAVMQQSEAVADSLGFMQAMRADDDRFAFVAQMPDVVEHDVRAEHIQPARRLIQQHDRRIVNQPAGEQHPLFLSRGKGRAALVEELGQAEQAGQHL